MKRLASFLVFFVMQFCMTYVNAQALPSTVFPVTVSNSGASYAGGTATAANASSITFANPANGAIYGEAKHALGIGGGRSVPVVLRSSPSGPVIAKAIGNFARGVGGAALKTAGAVYAAAEIAKSLNDLCNELGYSCYKGADGQTKFDKSDPTVCTVAPCRQYWLDLAAAGETARYSSISQAAQAALPLLSATYGGTWYVSSIANGWVNVCSDTCSGWRYGIQSASVAPSTATSLPSTIEELEASIAAQSGWPSTSALPKALEQAIASGQTLPLPQPTVTGPSTIQGPQTTQNTPSQNGQPASTKTTSTVYNITYQGNTVTTNNVTTTVVNNGSTTTTTTESKEEQPEPSPSDTANPDLPTLYKRQFPDGITGVWTTRKAELMATPIASLIGTMTPTITSSGGCPQFSIPASVGPLVFGTGSFGPPCSVWEFCKVVVLLTAAFLARALIFGG